MTLEEVMKGIRLWDNNAVIGRLRSPFASVTRADGAVILNGAIWDHLDREAGNLIGASVINGMRPRMTDLLRQLSKACMECRDDLDDIEGVHEPDSSNLAELAGIVEKGFDNHPCVLVCDNEEWMRDEEGRVIPVRPCPAVNAVLVDPIWDDDRDYDELCDMVRTCVAAVHTVQHAWATWTDMGDPWVHSFVDYDDPTKELLRSLGLPHVDGLYI